MTANGKLRHFHGHRAASRPARSHTEALAAQGHAQAVQRAMLVLLDGCPAQREEDRLKAAARAVTDRLSVVLGTSCSMSSKGPGAEVFAFRNDGGAE